MGPCIGHHHPPPDDDCDPPQMWEVECLAEFTFPENATEKGVSSIFSWGSRGDHPLNGLDDDCYATSISVFTGQGFRRMPEVFKCAIYSVLPSLHLDAKGSSSKGGDRQVGRAEVTVLHNVRVTWSVSVCPVSGRVTWSHPSWNGRFNIDRYLE